MKLDFWPDGEPSKEYEPEHSTSTSWDQMMELWNW